MAKLNGQPIKGILTVASGEISGRVIVMHLSTQETTFVYEGNIVGLPKHYRCEVQVETQEPLSGGHFALTLKTTRFALHEIASTA
jgi:hypothetical protein